MAKALKHNITMTVHTLGGNDFTAADTNEKKIGTNAFHQFMAIEIVKIEGEQEDTYIPFHAIEYVTVTKATDEVEYEDDTCVEEPIEP